MRLREGERDVDRVEGGHGNETGSNGTDRGKDTKGAGKDGCHCADGVCLTDGEGDGYGVGHKGGKGDQDGAGCSACQGETYHCGSGGGCDSSYWRGRGGEAKNKSGGGCTSDDGDGEDCCSKGIGDGVGGRCGGKGGDASGAGRDNSDSERVRFGKGDGIDSDGGSCLGRADRWISERSMRRVCDKDLLFIARQVLSVPGLFVILHSLPLGRGDQGKDEEKKQEQTRA